MSTDHGAGAARAGAAKWTFMVYMAANNSLSDFAGQDLSEMQTVGSSDAVKVLAFMKQRGGGNAYHIQVSKNGQHDVRENVGQKDSGHPQTVLDFIRWGVKTAPAQRYALVLWNHGGGWTPTDMGQLYQDVRREVGNTGVTQAELNKRAAQPMSRLLFSTAVKEILAQPTLRARQICNDDGTGHSLDTIELGKLLHKASEELGRPFDLLGMDACLMSTLEVAYQVRKEARIIAGSEELEPGDGWPYDTILARLAAQPDMGPEDLGKLVVQRYVEDYRGQPGQWPVTMAALATDRTEPFANAVDQLVQRLQSELASGWTKVQRAQGRSVRFEEDLYDLQTFCRQIEVSSLSQGVKTAARAVRDALKPGGYVLTQGHLGETVEGVGGATVYFPPPFERISKYYADLEFAKQHRWDDFLTSYHGAADRDG